MLWLLKPPSFFYPSFPLISFQLNFLKWVLHDPISMEWFQMTFCTHISGILKQRCSKTLWKDFRSSTQKVNKKKRKKERKEKKSQWFIHLIKHAMFLKIFLKPTSQSFCAQNVCLNGVLSDEYNDFTPTVTISTIFVHYSAYNTI